MRIRKEHRIIINFIKTVRNDNCSLSVLYYAVYVSVFSNMNFESYPHLPVSSQYETLCLLCHHFNSINAILQCFTHCVLSSSIKHTLLMSTKQALSVMYS